MAPLRLTRVRESYDALAGQLETSVQGVWEPHAQFDISDAGEIVVQCPSRVCCRWDGATAL